MICSALFDLNVIRSELKMEWLWLSLLSSKNFHLLLLSSRWTHLQLYIHAIERCIIANMLQQYENIKRYIVKNNGCSRMKKLCYFWKFYVILRGGGGNKRRDGLWARAVGCGLGLGLLAGPCLPLYCNVNGRKCENIQREKGNMEINGHNLA